MHDAVYFDPRDPRIGVVARAFDSAATRVPSVHRPRIRQAQRDWHKRCRSGAGDAEAVVGAALASASAYGVQRPLVHGLAEFGIVQPEVGSMDAREPGFYDVIMQPLSTLETVATTSIQAGRDIGTAYMQSTVPNTAQTFLQEGGQNARTMFTEGGATAREGIKGAANTVGKALPSTDLWGLAILGAGLWLLS